MDEQKKYEDKIIIVCNRLDELDNVITTLVLGLKAEKMPQQVLDCFESIRWGIKELKFQLEEICS
ncbi:MAG: hypothetical protein J6A73_05235 [Lachnospiraceae bacterium]|nr:hypothetical protein [Lachnospiraceae bacterium]